MQIFFENYFNYIKNQFPISICQKIINGFNKKRYTTFRVNTLKVNFYDVDKSLKENKIDYKKANFFNNAFYFTDIKEIKALKLDLTEKGMIYLQSYSSMLPAFIINPYENEKILDITAAPGSKTSLISALSNNKTTIYANEKNKIRYERLKYNMRLLGCNVHLINEKAENLHLKFNKFFDKVLADLPCSGEGRFLINDKKTYSNWSEDQVKKMANLQGKILYSALLTLKDGGLCVYSTCTLNKEENENVIEGILKDYDILPIDLNKFFGNLPNVYLTYFKKDKLSLPIYRILPSEFFEGFTIICFKKIKRY